MEDVLFFDPIVVDQTIPVKGSKIVQVHILSDHIEPLVLQLVSEDETLVQCSKIPTRIRPGEAKKFSLKVMNPSEGFHSTFVVFKVADSDLAYRYPIEIKTP